uniref:Uncharacterized protein n=1 Tax=Cacopsylla melanoneura TaxID=428564 RepID=A0A8D9FDX9_9HEMI
MSLLSKSKKKDSSKSKESKALAKKVARSRSKSRSVVKGSNKTKNIKGIMDKITFKIKKTPPCEDSDVIQTKTDDLEKVEKEPEVIQLVTETERKTEIGDNTNTVNGINTTHEEEDNAATVDDTNIVIANSMTVAETRENIIHDTNTPDENSYTTAMGSTEGSPHVTNSFTKDIQTHTFMILEHEMVGPGKYMLQEGAIIDDEEPEVPQDNEDTQEGVTGTAKG